MSDDYNYTKRKRMYLKWVDQINIKISEQYFRGASHQGVLGNYF